MEFNLLWHGTLKTYLLGFVSSFLLTSLSFFLVATNALEPSSLVILICILALLQAIVQILCFLHLGKETKPRWETYIFYFMLLVLFIVVGGSLWIMDDLHHRTMDMSQRIHTHD
jgi:cytochrome o ubiquinol oxidase operon protein cyoD